MGVYARLLIFLFFVTLQDTYAWGPDCKGDSFLPANKNFEGSKDKLELEYLTKKSYLLKWTSWLQDKLGTEMSWTQFERSQKISFLEQALPFDDPYLAYIDIKPTFYEIYAGYFGYHHYQKLIDEAAKANNTALKEKLIFEQYKHSQMVVRKWELYSGIYSYLLNTSKKGSGITAKNAQIVLEKLSVKYMMGDALKNLGVEKIETPDLAELWNIIARSHEAELADLRSKLNDEWIAVLVSLFSPGKIALKYGLKVTKIQGIKNIPKIGSLAEELSYALLANEHRFLYYPTIQKIVISRSTAAQKTRMLYLENVGTNNELMTTFARRADLKKTWEKMKLAAFQLKDKDPTFAAALVDMEKAETLANTLSPMGLQGRSTALNVVGRAIDIAVATAGYFIGDHYKLWEKLFGQKNTLGADRKIASTEATDESLEQEAAIAWQNWVQSVKPLTEKEQNEFDRLVVGLFKELKLL